MATKSYRLAGPTPESKELELLFRQVHDHITSLGMVLGKDAPAIHREFDVAHQSISSRAGLLQGMTMSSEDVHAFEAKVDAVKFEVAAHNTKAQVLKELRTLRVRCVDYIRKHDESRYPQVIVPPPSPPVVASSPIRTRTFEGEVWVSANDLEKAMAGLKAYELGPTPPRKK